MESSYTMETLKRPAWVEIDLGNLRHNIREIQDHVGDSKIIGVVKADAYGHGVLPVVRAMRECGVNAFAVATPEEGMELRGAFPEAEIVVLGLIPADLSDIILDYDLIPVVDSLSSAEQYAASAVKRGKTVRAFIAIDTGMGRIGYLTDDPTAIPQIAMMNELSGFRIEGLISHFATSDSPDKTFAHTQAARYNDFADRLRAAGIEPPVLTFANSAAVMDLSDIHYDAVRPGLIEYGYYPYEEADRSILDLKQVMSVRARIVKIKTVPAGYSVGYGRRFIAERESLIATLPLGYADGLPRIYSPAARYLVRGQEVKGAGNICMDQLMIDVTDVPGVKEGDVVTILGKDGDLSIDADDIGAACGTINHEILCGFGMRLPKVYRD